MFKGELVDLVLCLESQNLVICVLAEALAIEGLLVQFLDFVDALLNFAVIALVDTSLVLELLAPGINVLPQTLVLGLQVVQSIQRLLAPVLKKFDLMLVTAHLGCAGPHSLQVLFLFFQLIAQFLLLVAQHHVCSKQWG